MTNTIVETPPAPPPAPLASNPPSAKAAAAQDLQAVLQRLFELYPHLFGAQFLPLKLGVFQELLSLHPEHFDRESLKAALGAHTRSTRYLQSVAAGHKRHDLQGQPLEPVAPEHVCAALLELFRRRQGRSREDQRPRLRAQLMAAFEASGLSRQDFLSRVLTRDAAANALLEEAFAERDQRLARQEALLRAFDASGKSVAEFADMYGLQARDVHAALERKRREGLTESADLLP
jgi:sRNA-binding protein